MTIFCLVCIQTGLRKLFSCNTKDGSSFSLQSLITHSCSTSLSWWASESKPSYKLKYWELWSTAFPLLAGWGGQGALQSLSDWCWGEESRSGDHQEWDHHPDPRDGLPVRPHPQGCKYWLFCSKCQTFKIPTTLNIRNNFLPMMRFMLLASCCRWRSTGSSSSRPRSYPSPSTTRVCVKMRNCTSRASAISILCGVSQLMGHAWSPTRLIQLSHKTQGETSRYWVQ